MIDRESGLDQRPLLGPDGRIPAVHAVAVKQQGGLAALRAGWLPRHTLAMLLLTPTAFFGYRAALGAGWDTPTGVLVVLAMALVGALILTTYLPLRGAVGTGLSSCALMPALLVPMAAFLVNGPVATGSGFLALGLLGVGLVQRVSGANACR